MRNPRTPGESTVEESTLGLLPNPFQEYGVKFAATYIGETLGNVSGGRFIASAMTTIAASESSHASHRVRRTET